jgi:NCS1 family nucleobase:cation symporter-1
MTLSAPPRVGAVTSIETHSIEPIPDSERRGRVRDQFTLWFAANSTALNIFFGGLAITLGLSFGYAVLAIVIGTVIGSAISAVHAQQGPRLGVPQLVQSRGQFGYFGAVPLFAALVVMEFGFMASQVVIQAFSLHQAISQISVVGWMWIIAVPVLVLVLFGHDLMHAWQKLATIVLIISAVIVAIQVVTFKHAAAAPAPRFDMPTFLVVTAIFVINTAAWAPNISDYSRYLPRSVRFVPGFNAVFWGMTVAVLAFAILSAKIVSMLPSESLYAAVQSVTGSWFLIIMGISLIGTNAINVYTGALSAMSGLASFGKFRFTAVHRIIACVLMLAAGMACALAGYQSFLTSFVNFLDVLAFVFLPWSAINILDFYFFRHGDYDLKSLYTPRGIYGRFQPLPIACYLLGVLVELLFVNQSFYQGPLLSAVGGNDISWIVGFIVPLVAYWIAGTIVKRRAAASAAHAGPVAGTGDAAMARADGGPDTLAES